MTNIRPTDLPESRAAMANVLADPRLDEMWRDSFNSPLVAHGNDPDVLRKFFMSGLLGAQLYWIAAPMAKLAEAGARTVPAFDLQPEDVPSPDGLIIFEEPVTAIHMSDGADEVTEEMSALLWGQFKNRDGRSGIAAFALIGDKRIRLPIGAQVIPYGDATREVFYKVLQTCWLLMKQPLAETSDVEVDRAARKRLRREGYEPAPVRVIELRRAAHSGEASEGESNYQHQWIVRGHWRNHWHPKRQVHRPVWIAPHVKGPEGAPMIGGEKVYAWKR